METNEEKRENRVLLISLGGILVMIIAVAVVGFMFINEPVEYVQGQAEATEVKVSGKLPGRVERFFVKEGRDCVIRRGHLKKAKRYNRLKKANVGINNLPTNHIVNKPPPMNV